MLDRPLYQPTPEEVAAACEVLMRHGLSQEARRTVLSKYAAASRDCAKGLLRTAREHKSLGNHAEASRLAKNARWYWHCYIWEIAR